MLHEVRWSVFLGQGQMREACSYSRAGSINPNTTRGMVGSVLYAMIAFRSFEMLLVQLMM